MTLPPRHIALTTLALRRRLKQIADALVPAEVAILDISTATGTTQVATAFAELGIADVLGDEVLTAAQIAARLGTDAGTTHRLLRTRGQRRAVPDESPNRGRHADTHRPTAEYRPSPLAARMGHGSRVARAY